MKRFIEDLLFAPAFLVFFVVLRLAIWRKKLCRWVSKKRN